MIGKSGNRFSEKAMPKQKDTANIGVNSVESDAGRCCAQAHTGFEVRGALAVDVGAAIGDRTARKQLWVGVMKRIGMAAILLLFAGTFSLPGAAAAAQAAPSGMRTAQAPQAAATELSAQRRVRRPLRRVFIYPRYEGEPDDVYPRYFPGRNAVRDCTATYVQEYRPSGTVIVPHMNCYWRPG